MSQQIIDLTLRIENNMLAPDCFPRPVYIKAMTHEKSIEMHNGTPEDPITSSYNYLSHCRACGYACGLLLSHASGRSNHRRNAALPLFRKGRLSGYAQHSRSAEKLP